MADFTYKIPDEKRFFATVLLILSKSSKQKEKQIGEKLKGGNCSISPNGQYSRQRWNAYDTSIHFYVPIDNLDFFDKESIRILVEICDKVMPKDAGYDVLSVEITPSLDDISIDGTLTSDLEEIQNSISNQTINFLPDDIKQKGKEMSEVYAYLYCVENSLRLFIEKIFTANFGNNYWTQITIPNSVKKSIEVRKENERKNQWISIRGNSELYYLDFKDLSDIITNNWSLFKDYFPQQQWLNVKIEELANCRNLIAHNSYLSSMERDVIRLNYNQILKQIRIVSSSQATSSIIETTNNYDDELPF